MSYKDEYPQRLVAFIDILGFRELIKRLDTEKRLFTKLKKALNQFSREDMYYNDRLFTKTELKARQFGREITSFSDSIVISYPLDGTVNLLPDYDIKTNAVFWLLRDVFGLYLYLSPLKIPIRGAISAGKLYHKDDVIFGEGLVKAYDTERNFAKYPRVLIPDQIIKDTDLEVVLNDSEARDSVINFIKRDNDNSLFFDHLSFSRIFSGMPMHHVNFRNHKKHEHAKYAPCIKEIVLEMLENAKQNRELFEKASWYLDYYNRHVKAETFYFLEPI